jgi:hypothetical protein
MPSACGWRVSLLCSSRVACKKERGSHFTNALLSNDACPLDVPAVQNPNRMASTIYESSRGCIWRRVEGADFASASPFVGLVLPITRLIAPSLISKKSATPLKRTSIIRRHRRHERHFSRYQWGFLRDDLFLACSGSVTSSSWRASPKKRLT